MEKAIAPIAQDLLDAIQATGIDWGPMEYDLVHKRPLRHIVRFKHPQDATCLHKIVGLGSETMVANGAPFAHRVVFSGVREVREAIGRLRTFVSAPATGSNGQPTPPVKRLSIGSIRLDGDTQPRAAIDDDLVHDYAEAYKAGAKFPPLVVFFDGDDYWLADGFHRWHAARQAGLTKMACDVRQGTLDEARWYSYSVNQTHGLRRTNADKAKAVKAALQHPNGVGLSDRQIDEAFRYFADYYHPGGIFDHFSAGQPLVTRDEFMHAVLEDYDEAMQGKTEHPLFEDPDGSRSWEWASVERESVRDRILISRGRKPIGWDITGWPDGRFEQESDETGLARDPGPMTQSAAREPTTGDVCTAHFDARFGFCPKCREPNEHQGYVNVSKSHAVVCNVHKLFWWIGANLFSSWKDEKEETWVRNRELLRECQEVKPMFCQCPDCVQRRATGQRAEDQWRYHDAARATQGTAGSDGNKECPPGVPMGG